MREKFIEAIRAQKDDPVPRWVFADWLEENGDQEEAASVRLEENRLATKRQPTEISDLLGRILSSIEIPKDQEVAILTMTGDAYYLYHSQDCCESVMVEKVEGNLQDLIGCPITVAEVAVYSNSNPPGIERPDNEYSDYSWTWTIYRLATKKGEVIIRWLGESNGYYSESVDFCEGKPE